MKTVLKKMLVTVAGLLLVVTVVGVVYVLRASAAFDASMSKVYAVPVPEITLSTDAAVLARGKHLVESVGGCTDCHGLDLGGSAPREFGPLGVVSAPNISPAGAGAVYTDGELARLILYGVKKDGRSVVFMPSQELNWLPDSDIVAMISYLRTVPGVDRPNGPSEVKWLGKVFDRRDHLILDVARRIAESPREIAPSPAPTVEYGKYVARLCSGCHGDRHLSGGSIPGAPPSVPVPLNLTSHETGLKDWTFEDMDRLLTTGTRKNGRPLDPFMPYKAYANMDVIEKRALWEYLRSLPPMPFGGR